MSKAVVPIGTERSLARQEANPFAFLQQEIDRLFDGFSRNFPTLTNSGATLPKMDVSETDKLIEVTAELPGLETKDVEVNLVDNVLTIRGEKKSEREESKKDYRLVERSFGSFARSVELPEGVKSEDVTAEIAKGVLKVTVKKPAPKQAKQIQIKSAA
ncbi:MAG TPA: Hsp20/alpha crystallin family protein [Bradyrhizobium sp.]|nr:Hsp20/alpha crystallin family protein [Bradyrhizobium sp.]